MKRPWYLPEKEEKGDKWQPGDEPSLKGFLAGFMVGLDGGKAKVDQKNYVAEFRLLVPFQETFQITWC